MLQRLYSTHNRYTNMLIYCPSTSLTVFLRSVIKEGVKADKDYIVDLMLNSDAKLVNAAVAETQVMPFKGEKWLLHINADLMEHKDLKASVDKNSANSVKVYWTTKYKVFKKLESEENVKKQGVHFPFYSFSRMGFYDLKFLYEKMMDDSRYSLDEGLVNYVCKNYQYDVQAAFDLFDHVRNGGEVRSKKDIIDKVGLGGNSVGSLTLAILNVHYSDTKSLNNSRARLLRLLLDLSYTHTYDTMYNYISHTVEAFYEIKQLQIMGYYKRVGKAIPDSFNEKRILQHRRFENAVLNELSLPQILNLKMLLKKYRYRENSEISLIQVIDEYLSLRRDNQ